MAKGIGKNPGGPWYSSYKTVLFFESRALDEYPTLNSKNFRSGHKLWRQYNLQIFLEDYDQTRQVTIKFKKNKYAPPSVTADGPTDSPHRYEKGELCMWYPWTIKEHRWAFQDGLLHLLVMIEAHLFREAWWRETGEWLGPERAHGNELI